MSILATNLGRSLALAAVLGLFVAPAAAQVLDEATGEVVHGVQLDRLLPADTALPGSARGEDTLNLVAREAQGETRGIDLVGSILYRSNGGYLEIIDVSDPEAHVVLGRFLVDDAMVSGVDVQGDYAYVAASRSNIFQARGSLQIVDVSDPANPVAVGAVTGRSFYDVVVSGTTAYGAALGGGLRLYDVADPANPEALGFATVSGGSVLGVALDGTMAYVAAGGAGMRAIDVSDTAAPTIVGSFSVDLYPDLFEFATDVVYDDGYVYLAVQSLGLVIVDVTDPTNPVEAGHYLVTDAGAFQIRSVAVDGDTVYLGKDDGFIVLDVSDAADIERIATLEFGVPGSSQSILVDGNIAWVGNRYHGVRALDIETPSSPSQITLIQNGGFSFKVNVVGNIAYVVDLIGELRLIDLADPYHPQIIGRLGGLSSPYRVDVVGGVAYIAHQAGGAGGAGHVTRVDVADPTSPTVIDVTPLPSHANGVHVVGDIAYVAAGMAGTGEGSLITMDSDDMGLIGSADAGNTAFDVRVSGDHAYIATFGSGLTVIDVSDPAAMTPVSMGAVGAFSNSLVVDGSTLYLADLSFAGPQGLLVVDVSDPANPQVLGSGDIMSGGTAVDVAYHSGFAYVVVDFVGLYQYDVSDPSMVVETEFVITSNRATGVDVLGPYVVAVDAGAGVWIFHAPGTIASEGGASPEVLMVDAGYPNPFSAQTTVRYRIPEAGHVRVTVHDVMGRQVATLVDDAQTAGSHEAVLPAAGLASGVYFVRVTTGSETAVRQVTLVR